MASPASCLSKDAIDVWCQQTGFTPLPRTLVSTSNGMPVIHGRTTDQDQHEDGNAQITTFTTVMFNMLAGSLADASTHYGGFDNADPEPLKWDCRGKRLLKCIYEAAGTETLPDILMLCELDHQHYESTIEPALTGMGYDGTFYSKIVKGGGQRDGSCIFWNKTRFSKQKVHTLKVADLTQIGLIVTLSDVVAKKSVMVATTHLKSKPGRENEAMRLQLISKLVEKIMDVQSKDDEKADAIVLGGDFNTGPSSPVVEMVESHNLTWVHRNDNVRPAYTTRKKRKGKLKSHIIDYLFTQGLNVDAVTGTYGLEENPPILPNERFPSDHLNIAARVNYK